MSVPIPHSHHRLLVDPVLAHLATVMSDGRPQVHPVWCDYDGTYVRVNAAEGAVSLMRTSLQNGGKLRFHAAS